VERIVPVWPHAVELQRRQLDILGVVRTGDVGVLCSISAPLREPMEQAAETRGDSIALNKRRRTLKF